jgi:glycosyltransferase involved in cell wall biosynthesis
MVMGSALAEQLAPLKVDHIHAHHGYFACWMALVAARLLGIGFSFTLHGSDLLLRGDLLAAKLRACQFCMTVSEFNRQYILQHYPSTSSRKIVLRRLGVDSVPSPMPTSLESAPRQRRFCLLSVGRLHPVKDHDFLIQGCAALRDQGLDFICWILGEGRERRALEEQIVRLGLCGRIYLIGHVAHNDLPRYYGYADLVVMTSRSEGIPVVLMEAMAHEKIVLAPAITGIAELIDHRRTGFLYQPGSLPDFISAVSWIHGHQSSLSGLQHAAAASIAANYNRRRNLRVFAEQFLARIPQSDGDYAHSVLQQIRLSV